MRKERHLHRAHHIVRATLDNPTIVKGTTVVLVDDIATSGKTLLRATDECIKGGALAVYAVVVHQDMRGDVLAAISNQEYGRYSLPIPQETGGSFEDLQC